MKKSRRPGVPESRFSRRDRTGRERADGPRSLASRAGIASFGAESAMETLEERKLLFALTITADDILPGQTLGTRTAEFAYVLPFLFSALPDPEAPAVIIEEFADEGQQPWAQQIPAQPPSGTFFQQSDIRISYARGSPASPAPLVTLIVGPDIVNGMPNNDLDLAVTLRRDNRLSFQFFDGVQQNDPTLRMATSAAAVIRTSPEDADGLRTDLATGTRVELLRNGQVVATFRGAALAALAVPVNNQGPGAQRFTFNFAAGFDEIRFSSSAPAPDNVNYDDRFIIDQVEATFPPGRFADFIDDRVFGARVVFTGPVGATARFLDLYGREIVQTLRLQTPEGRSVPVVDQNDDGIPDFNDGIGRVIITGTNKDSAITMIGGTIEDQEGTLTLQFADNVNGLFDEFMDAGFGYAIVGNPPEVVGLPRGGGTLVIGSPFVRPIGSQDAHFNANALAQIVPDNFRRADQGIKVEGGASIGGVLVHGAIHGQNVFSGAVGRLALGYLPGSVSVNGDMGELIVQSDAGHWVLPTGNGPTNTTNSTIIVGRTTRDISVGGRLTSDIQVLGDVNNTSRAKLNFRTYFERERPLEIDVDADVATTYGAILDRNANPVTQGAFFGAGFFRNDSIASAEFVGFNATSVRIVGTSNGNDPVNTSDDSTDVYSFAADPSREVVIATSSVPDYLRIVNADGIVLAALAAGESVLRFTPDHTDIYYLVVNSRPTDGSGATPYEIRLSGIAPVTLGSVRSGLGVGVGDPNTIEVLGGSMGVGRFGTGHSASDGGQATGLEASGAIGDVDDLMNIGAVTLTTARDLFGLIAGSDINGLRLRVGRDLGSIETGLAPTVGIAVTEGDLTNADIRIGGRVARVNINGGLCIDQDPDPDSRAGFVNFQTGTAGGPGDIGTFLVGAYMSGAGFTLTTSPGSRIDTFIVGGNTGGAGSSFPSWILNGQPTINMGPGSDFRFADFGLIQNQTNGDVFQAIAYGTGAPNILTLTDDAGASVRLTFSGGTSGARDASTILVRTLPINGSRGVAIARVEVNLLGGANLIVEGITPGVVSIGRIDVTTDSIASNIDFRGQAEIDVWRLNVGGAGVNNILNSSVGGDIVAIDAAAMNTLTITRGDLGRTQTHGIGPTRLGLFVGMDAGRQGAVGGPLGVDEDAVNEARPGSPGEEWGGGIFVPVDVVDYDLPAFLEDLGGPIDPWLDGVVVRGGDVQSVTVSGRVGDVIVEEGLLVNLLVNSDGVTAAGGFDGIIGNVYAVAIGTVDIGDGLVGPGPSPLAAAGIFADGSIVEVRGGRVRGAVISGLIYAAGVSDELTPGLFGIGTVTLTDGLYDNASIGATTLEAWWLSPRVAETGEVITGVIGQVLGIRSNLFRSDIRAVTIPLIQLTNAVFDASQVTALNNIGRITAASYRNSLLLGEPAEFEPSLISATQDVDIIETAVGAGDIDDLVVDIEGSLTGRIQGRNFSRVSIDVDNRVTAIIVGANMRSSQVAAGRLESITVQNDLRLTSFNIAGPVVFLDVQGEIRGVEVNSTGPDGRIGTFRARQGIVANISTFGRIDSIESVNGDVEGSIRTTDASGTLNSLRAGRDVVVDMLVTGSVTTINAGRHIGRLGETTERTIDVRGSLQTVNAPNGQVYTDIVVGQNIGTITNGRVIALPGNDQVARADIRAFGSIGTLNLFGDFNGDIISDSGGIQAVNITAGSLRQGRQIIARDGNIGDVVIVDGHLLGDIIADGSINRIEVRRGAEGFTGHIGPASALSTGRRFDDFRNLLPPGTVKDAGYNGVLISAGTNLNTLTLQRGRMFESTVYAGQVIGSVFLQGGVRNDALTRGSGGSAIVAGDRIDRIDSPSFFAAVIVGAGFKSLGADNRAGGTGANADVIGTGSIGEINLGRRAANVQIVAGVNADPASGRYDFDGATKAGGESSFGVLRIAGQRTNVTLRIDGTVGSRPSGVRTDGESLAQSDPSKFAGSNLGTQLPKDTDAQVTLPSGERATIRLSGAGSVFFRSSTGVLSLLNTNASSSLVISSNTGALTDFTVVGNDGASLGTLDVRAQLLGASALFIDAGIATASFDRIDTTGIVGTAGDIGTLRFQSFLNGEFTARDIGAVTITGDLGRRAPVNDAILFARNITSFNSRVVFGRVSVERNLTTLTTGAVENGAIRAGRVLGTINVASLLNSRIVAGTEITTLNVQGDAIGSLVSAGGDVGRDTFFGGTGANADTVRNGLVGSVNVGGNFSQSDVAAGVLRGNDGFFGSADDLAAPGRSRINSVRIGGTQVGSTLNSESYRVVSTGTIGTVTRAGQPVLGPVGNFSVVEVGAFANPVQVTDLRVIESSRVYSAILQFNQAINSGTLAAALRVQEVRSGGQFITLSQGTDYAVTYNAVANQAVITFSPTVTQRNLPQTSGLPGPGVYRFTLDANILRGVTTQSFIDGNSDGIAGDAYSEDAIVGDAGDKLVAGNPVGFPTIDFYGPINLDVVLDNNYTPDGLPDINRPYTLRGTIGDHPDTDPQFFRSSGDVDVYAITLRSGQILRLGAIGGAATGVQRVLIAPDGSGQFVTGGTLPINLDDFDFNRDLPFFPVNLPQAANTPFVLTLPKDTSRFLSGELGEEVLIKQTGTYFIAVTAAADQTNPTDTNAVANLQPIPGASGTYEFSIEVFDDGDTGFRGDNNASNGRPLPVVPIPTDFGVGSTLVIGEYTFTLDRGSLPNNRGDVVRGTDNNGVTVERRPGNNRIWGDIDDRIVTTVNSSIGAPGFIGVPVQVAPDIDVYHLNGGEAIAPGTRFRITLRLTDLGSNIGLSGTQDLRGAVQLGIFEVPLGTGFGDGLLIASPSDFLPIGGRPAVSVGDGNGSYGYDDNGDFYFEFFTPGALFTNSPVPASYAIAIQGAIRSDYVLEVVSSGQRQVQTRSQNVVIEVRGGMIDWLEAGDGVTTSLDSFDVGTAGFSGIIGGQTAQNYILNRVLNNLRQIFNATGASVSFSSDTRAFEGQPFSTVFLTSTAEPSAFFNDGTYGASQRSDPFNGDRTDQAVVFAPSLTDLAFDTSDQGADIFADALSAAIARRVGELVGLRITAAANSAASPVPVDAADSVVQTPAGGLYRFLNASRPLSANVGTDGQQDVAIDTDFFIGNQNAARLLNRFLSNP